MCVKSNQANEFSYNNKQPLVSLSVLPLKKATNVKMSNSVNKRFTKICEHNDVNLVIERAGLSYITIKDPKKCCDFQRIVNVETSPDI